MKAWKVRNDLGMQGIFFSPTVEQAETAAAQVWKRKTKKLERSHKKSFSCLPYYSSPLPELDSIANLFATDKDLAEESGQIREEDLVSCPCCDEIIGAFGIACASLSLPARYP